MFPTHRSPGVRGRHLTSCSSVGGATPGPRPHPLGGGGRGLRPPSSVLRPEEAHSLGRAEPLSAKRRSTAAERPSPAGPSPCRLGGCAWMSRRPSSHAPFPIPRTLTPGAPALPFWVRETETLLTHIHAQPCPGPQGAHRHPHARWDPALGLGWSQARWPVRLGPATARRRPSH